MSNFIKFRDAVNSQLTKMTNMDAGLFLTHVDKSEIWDTYLSSFPEGTNPIFIENTVHDCNCCKDFIRDIGRSVSIDDKYNIVTAWDIEIDDETYQAVADALGSYVRSRTIASIYRASSYSLNRKSNKSLEVGKELMTFDHFYFKVPSKYAPKNDNAEKMGESRNRFNVLNRTMKEFTVDSMETVLGLIDDNNLYLGEQNQSKVSGLLELKRSYDKVANKRKENFVWKSIGLPLSIIMLRSSAIGTLLVDLSEGMNLDSAVASYEAKVAPHNYKRSKSVVTRKMVEDAQAKVVELGMVDSLNRRHSSLEDISINNVIWADRGTTEKLVNGNVFDELIAESTDSIDNMNAKDISLVDFVDKVVPAAKSVQMYLENVHSNNMVSLVSPVDNEAPNLMKWNNSFSWSYNGGTTDSVKARVASKGGKVDGDLRVSLSWFNTDDLDIHLRTPTGRVVYHAMRSHSGLKLDVDMNIHSGSASINAVENISADSIHGISEGDYTVMVKNFTRRNNENTGYELELEFLGKVLNFSSRVSPNDQQTVESFVFNYSRANGVVVKSCNIEQEALSSEVWGIKTCKLHNVDSIMWSPNHWDDNEVGNRHLFLMLKDCKNPEPVRGFYNEYLVDSLHNHRKVFEVLASKMKAEYSEDQLSGVGFSTTKKGDSFKVLVDTNKGKKLYNVNI